MTDAYTLTNEADQLLIEKILEGFAQARLRRYNFEAQWQEASLICWPEYANTFFFGYDQYPGQKKTQQQIDSSGAIASHRFASIVDSLMTPMGLMWSRLRPTNPELLKDRNARIYFDKLTAALWSHRYRAHANFAGQSLQNYQSLAVFGNMNMFVDELDGAPFGGEMGLRYTSIPVGQMYYIQNQQGVVAGYYRAFRWTAQQIYRQWPDTFPEALRPALEKRSQQLFWVLEFVCPRTDWQPFRIDAKGKPFAKYYISLEGRCVLEEGGYRTFPTAIGRYMMAPDEDYGRGPAQMVLPALKTLNAEKMVFLKQGHWAGDPIFLTPEAGLVDPMMYPGATIKGGMSHDGKKLIGALETGNIQITEEMMQEERKFVDDAFLVSLFQLAVQLKDAPDMSARQVLEYIEQRGILIAPTIGRQQSEYLGALIPRELDVLAYIGKLPKMPDSVKEARGDYEVEFTNPITRAMKASEIAGFMQMIEMTKIIAQDSQDDSVWDHYDLDVAIPEIGENRAVPARFMASQAQIDAKRKQRAQAAKREADAKEMPARAAIIKAEAIKAKAATGGNIGGTLSGTPEGGMPQIPGNPQGTPGVPGFGGQPGISGRPA